MRSSRQFLGLVALGGALLIPEAQAGYLGLEVESKPNGFGIKTCSVYAAFDGGHPDDRVLQVIGNSDFTVSVQVVNGTFYQHVAGNDRAPFCGLLGVFPALAYDTFVTIGLQCNDGTDDTSLIGWPGFGPSSLFFDSGAWYLPTLTDPQGAPDSDNRVLLGRFSTTSTTDGVGITGSLPVELRSNGTFMIVVESFEHLFNEFCDGDTNDDGLVNVDDLNNVILDWGTDGSAHGGDVTGQTPGSPPDGAVDVNDLNVVLVGWGACP